MNSLLKSSAWLIQANPCVKELCPALNYENTSMCLPAAWLALLFGEVQTSCFHISCICNSNHSSEAKTLVY